MTCTTHAHMPALRRLRLTLATLTALAMTACGPAKPGNTTSPASGAAATPAKQKYWQCCAEPGGGGVASLFAKCTLTDVVTVAPESTNDLPRCEVLTYGP